MSLGRCCGLWVGSLPTSDRETIVTARRWQSRSRGTNVRQDSRVLVDQRRSQQALVPLRTVGSSEKLASFFECEDSTRDRIPFRAAACIVGMQMVSAVVARQQLLWVAWVSQNSVKVHHAIEFAAAENPLVDLLAHTFFLGSVESD